MSVNPSPFGPKPQWFLSSGLPAVGYKLFAYVAGSTSTKQDTFTDSGGGTANANPIVLDSNGYVPDEIWLTAGQSYKLVLAPSTDTDPPSSPIWSADDLTGINDTSAGQDQWVSSNLTPTYVSGTSFTLVGDQTSTFTQYRRIKTQNSGGTIYSMVASSSYSAPNTTVTVTNDTGTLDAGLSSVSYGIVSAENTSLPFYQNGVMTLSGAILTGGTANGVAYLNGSKALTTGTGIQFDGTNLMVGTASRSDTETVSVSIPAANALGTLYIPQTNISYYAEIYRNSSNSGVGSIYCTSTTTTFNTSSDYRLKNIEGPLTGYKERIMALEPEQGTWKSDGSVFRGFVAHKFALSYPSSVIGEKDAVSDKGKPIMQAMQASSSEVMADLIALVKDLVAENDSLKARLDAAGL